MSDELRTILATLGGVATLVLIPFISQFNKAIMTLNKISQTIYGENGNNGLKSTVKDLSQRVEALERHLGRREEDHHP